MRTAAQAKRDRAALMKAIERELRTKNRGKLLALRAEWRRLRRERKSAIASALQGCRARRPPTLAQVRAELRAERARARQLCDLDLEKARALQSKAHQAKAELVAERAYQAAMRRIEAANRQKQKAVRRPLAKARDRESDDEVRGNIPPELVPLFDRVRRQIRATDRMTRTEAFLQYAHDHESEGEQWAALEGRVDDTIRELERRQAMSNPKKKNKRAKKAKAPRRAAAKRATKPKKRAAPKKPRAARAKKTIRRAHPVGRWWEPVLASPAARKYARDRSSVRGDAAYWRLPSRVRMANVKKLVRSGKVRAAVALARAEQARAEGPPARRRNPRPMGDRAAADEYERTHWGRRGGERVRQGRAADPRFGTATQLGKLVQITYETRKGDDDEPVHYVHDFEGPHPKLAYNAGGLLIVGGGYKVGEGGIDG